MKVFSTKREQHNASSSLTIIIIHIFVSLAEVPMYLHNVYVLCVSVYHTGNLPIYLYKIMRYKIKLCLKYVFRQKSWYYQSPDYEIQFYTHNIRTPSPQSQNQMILISSCKPFFTLAIMVFKSSTCYQLSIFNTARRHTPTPLLWTRAIIELNKYLFKSNVFTKVHLPG